MTDHAAQPPTTEERTDTPQSADKASTRLELAQAEVDRLRVRNASLARELAEATSIIEELREPYLDERHGIAPGEQHRLMRSTRFLAHHPEENS